MSLKYFDMPEIKTAPSKGWKIFQKDTRTNLKCFPLTISELIQNIKINTDSNVL